MLEVAMSRVSTPSPGHSGFYRLLPCPPSSLFLFKKPQNYVVLSCFLSFGLPKQFSLNPSCLSYSLSKRENFSFHHHKGFRRGHFWPLFTSTSTAWPQGKTSPFQMHRKERTRRLSHNCRMWVTAGVEDDHSQRHHHSPVLLYGPTLQHPQQ